MLVLSKLQYGGIVDDQNANVWSKQTWEQILAESIEFLSMACTMYVYSIIKCANDFEEKEGDLSAADNLKNAFLREIGKLKQPDKIAILKMFYDFVMGNGVLGAVEEPQVPAGHKSLSGIVNSVFLTHLVGSQFLKVDDLMMHALRYCAEGRESLSFEEFTNLLATLGVPQDVLTALSSLDMANTNAQSQMVN
jgi:hypothetical protein